MYINYSSVTLYLLTHFFEYKTLCNQPEVTFYAWECHVQRQTWILMMPCKIARILTMVPATKRIKAPESQLRMPDNLAVLERAKTKQRLHCVIA